MGSNSAIQISATNKSLYLPYETEGDRFVRFLSIPLDDPIRSIVFQQIL